MPIFPGTLPLSEAALLHRARAALLWTLYGRRTAAGGIVIHDITVGTLDHPLADPVDVVDLYTRQKGIEHGH